MVEILDVLHIDVVRSICHRHPSSCKTNARSLQFARAPDSRITAQPVRAKDYPSRPMRYVVGGSVGGGGIRRRMAHGEKQHDAGCTTGAAVEPNACTNEIEHQPSSADCAPAPLIRATDAAAISLSV